MSDRERYSHLVMMNDATSAPVARRTDYGHSDRFDVLCNHTAYGLTCEDYEAMRDRAQDKCEICNTPDHQTTRGRLIIDHFQSKDLFFVRGLLCDRCNSVMSRHDRTRPWGPASLPFADKARTYHLNAFGRPTPEELQRADEAIQQRRGYARREDKISNPPRAHRKPRGANFLRLDHGPKAIARGLRSYLTPAQIARLVELLTNEKGGETRSEGR